MDKIETRDRLNRLKVARKARERVTRKKIAKASKRRNR